MIIIAYCIQCVYIKYIQPWWNWYLTPMVNFCEVWRAQLAKSILLTSMLGPWDLLRSAQMLEREWSAEISGKLPHLFVPSKTATLVPAFAVKDLPLGRTLWWWYRKNEFPLSWCDWYCPCLPIAGPAWISRGIRSFNFYLGTGCVSFVCVCFVLSLAVAMNTLWPQIQVGFPCVSV